MRSVSDTNLAKITAAFSLNEPVQSNKPYGSGHINDTFLINTQGGTQYLLQRINHEVFTNVSGLMSNMSLVTQHLRKALKSVGNSQFTTPQIIGTNENKLFYQDQQGQYWRMMTFIERGVSYDQVTSDEQAFQAGYAFGYFQKLLADLSASQLTATIPDFHNMARRFSKFHKVLRDDPVGKKGEVAAEIEFALAHESAMIAWYQRTVDNTFPQRITHNDTKFNNVLLDRETQQAICVIDLDTVMPGVVGYDFGDAIRTIVNTAAEDEPNVDKIDVNLSFYRAFAEGFLGEVGSVLTKFEIQYLPFSAHYMTFIMGLRFLTDYLEGNVYYKVAHPEHNRYRARAQFTLVSRLEELSSEIENMLFRIAK